MTRIKPATIAKAFHGEGMDIGSYDDIRQLDLKVCDKSVPGRHGSASAKHADQSDAGAKDHHRRRQHTPVQGPLRRPISGMTGGEPKHQ